jgi:hypothetical protein
MKLFKVYLIIILIVGTFVGISRFFSPTYRVQENIVVNKPIDQTFAFMSNMQNWERWSLWNKTLDSTLFVFYTPKSDSLGARQYLTGQLIGKGFIEITQYKVPHHLGYRMTLREGEITANGSFEFTAINDAQTQIAWVDSGDVGDNPIKRYMIPFVTKSTAETFRTGLARIKTAIEK